MDQAEVVGVDVGGTFTDFVFIGPEGQLSIRKRASTPHDPAESVQEGIREALAAGRAQPGFALVHGTTVATNALLERRGARTALITTEGFRDVLEIGRQARSTLYSLHPSRPAPLLSRESRHELKERIDWRGEIVTPLDEAQAIALLDRLAAGGVESVAVCFLFSYLNPAHERRVGTLARERSLSVSLSCEVAPEPREYERASTTAANAFVAPVMDRYLRQLERQTHALGAGSLRVMQSDGGALSAPEAAARAIKTVLSGPAGGVVAAAQIGAEAGCPNLLTLDMGGTSTDVALLLNGRLPVVTDGVVAGMAVRTSMLDIHTVGAGGGSLARVDAAGGLRVGPQSAGADPGPVAYGKGETLTVTDANLLLGRLPADILLAGQLPLDGARVRRHFDALAHNLRCTPEEAALGIIRVVDAAMARALRHTSVERGYDPTEFTLLSYGGAGGLHACALAEALSMPRILVPRYPGAFSALGLALADVMREYVQALSAGTPTGDWQSPEVGSALESRFAALESQAACDMEAEGFRLGTWHAQRFLDLRYAGQSFDLRVPLIRDDLAATITTFHVAHRIRYGHADPGEPVEAVAIRLVAIGGVERARLVADLPAHPGEPCGETGVVFETDRQRAALYKRETLATGQRLDGPAIVLQSDATTLIAPGWRAQVDTAGNLILRRSNA